MKFTHAWGGVIDTCSRFSVFWGQAMGGRVAYAVGYTGLGVASTRFGAEVMLDLLDGKRSKATQTNVRQGEATPLPARAVPVHRHPDHALVTRTARTAPANATSGCAASTGWASASTADTRCSRLRSASLGERTRVRTRVRSPKRMIMRSGTMGQAGMRTTVDPGARVDLTVDEGAGAGSARLGDVPATVSRTRAGSFGGGEVEGERLPPRVGDDEDDHRAAMRSSVR